MIALFSMILAFTLTLILLPGLNKLAGQQLSLSTLLTPRMIAMIVLTPIIVGTLSGLYPALFMSSFQPVKVLKGWQMDLNAWLRWGRMKFRLES